MHAHNGSEIDVSLSSFIVCLGQNGTATPLTTEAPTTITPCALIKCGFYARCEVSNGTAGCVCPSLCPDVWKPVCGSNGKTYGNTCELERDSCKNEQFIRVKEQGPCMYACLNSFFPKILDMNRNNRRVWEMGTW